MKVFITISPEEALKLMKTHPEINIIDIRPRKEFEEDHVPGADNLDYDGHQFPQKVEKLDKNKKYIIYCRSGVRGGYFLEKMKDTGFKEAYNILGGYVGWKIRALPLVKE